MDGLISALVADGPVALPSGLDESQRVIIERASACVHASMNLMQFMWAFLDEIRNRCAELRRPMPKDSQLLLWARYHRKAWEASCAHGFGSPVFREEIQQQMDCDSVAVVFDFNVEKMCKESSKYAQASAAVVAGNLRHLILSGALLVFDGMVMREIHDPEQDDVGVIFVPLTQAIEALRELRPARPYHVGL